MGGGTGGGETGGGTGGGMGGGTGGGETGGGTGGASGGGTGGGETGGGAGGGTADGGCDSATYDPVLGTLKLAGGATVQAFGPLPDGIVAVNEVGGVYYGVSDTTGYLHTLGTSLSALALGAPLASVRSPADLAADAGVFISNYLASQSGWLVAGYTKFGTNFPGSLLVYDTRDGGAQYVDAPGNYSVVGHAGGFVVNGLGLGTSAQGASAYGLNVSGTFPQTWQLATFDPAWMAASGYTASVGDVLVVGYFGGIDFKNYLRAAGPGLYAAPFTNQTSFALSQAPVILEGFDIRSVSGTATDLIVHRGGFDSEPPYAYTTAIERIPLTVMGSGSTETVQTGTPVTLVTAPDRCTRVLFIEGLLVGVEDRNGRRLVRLAP
jgi:hypothetical protein